MFRERQHVGSKGRSPATGATVKPPAAGGGLGRGRRACRSRTPTANAAIAPLTVPPRLGGLLQTRHPPTHAGCHGQAPPHGGPLFASEVSEKACSVTPQFVRVSRKSPSSAGEIRIQKLETCPERSRRVRNKPEARMLECSKPVSALLFRQALCADVLVIPPFRISDLFRVSDFEFRIWGTLSLWLRQRAALRMES